MEKNHKRSDGQTIARAVEILRTVATNPGASFGQIAKETGLPRSTVQRLVGVLNQEGLVTKAFGQQGTYLGMELARLGASVRIDARALLRPFMEELHSEIGDNIDLTTIESGRVFVIEQIASNETIRVISYVGLQHPIHCTANGKAHLSLLTESEGLSLLQGELTKYNARTLTKPDEILANIKEMRETGLFVDDGEYDEDASAIAVPLPQIGGKDFAVSIAMPTARMEKMRNTVGEALLRLREKVIAEYGLSI